MGLCCAGLIVNHSPAAAATPGTAFSYQGQLTESVQVANGLYDLQVCLFDSLVNPVEIICAADADDVPVEAGLFAISIDLGAGVFAGQERYLGRARAFPSPNRALAIGTATLAAG